MSKTDKANPEKLLQKGCKTYDTRNNSLIINNVKAFQCSYDK